MAKREERSLRVRDFVVLNHELTDSQVVNHFHLEGYGRNTVYRILQRIKENVSMKKKEAGGRKPVKLTSAVKEKLVSLA